MKKILLVFGTRPEAIKMAPLVHEFKKHPEDFQTIVCVTGQHREMLDQVLDLFQIVPDYDLNIMKPNQDLYDVTSRILLGMRDVLKEVKPDVVFVHGDTTTSTASALAAFYQQIPVAHVEAGLRTGNIYSPWPEEMNRLITGRIAAYNFSPTPLSKQNLLKENVAESTITVTGNTVIDALQWVVKKIESETELSSALQAELLSMGYDTNRLADGKRLVLITGHLHAGFSEFSYEKIDTFHSFNVPALNIDNKDGAEGGDGSGLTYIVEVYDDEIENDKLDILLSAIEYLTNPKLCINLYALEFSLLHDET